MKTRDMIIILISICIIGFTIVVPSQRPGGKILDFIIIFTGLLTIIFALQED